MSDKDSASWGDCPSCGQPISWFTCKSCNREEYLQEMYKEMKDGWVFVEPFDDCGLDTTLAKVDALERNREVTQEVLDAKEMMVEEQAQELTALREFARDAKLMIEHAILYANELDGFHFGDGDICESLKRTGKPCPTEADIKRFKLRAERLLRGETTDKSTDIA